MSQTRVQTIRKAAILVASLDEQQGRQLTSGLSASDTDLLRQAVADLGPIEPEERQQVFQELRLGTSPESIVEEGRGLDLEEGVELDWSPDTKEKYGIEDPIPIGPSGIYHARQPGKGSPASQPTDRALANRGKPFDFLGSHDTQIMAKKLLDEPPQIIAVVMSQVAAELAADLLREMPLTLQTEVLERLAQLHPADQQSLEVVENHLAGWIESHRQQQQRLSQGNEKVRQILARTSSQQRKKILGRLGRQNQAFAHHATAPPTGPPEPRRIAPAVATTDAPPTEAKEPLEDLAGCDMEALNQVSNAMLLEALRKTEPQIAMLALAGAPPHLLDRILGQLPWRQAKRFRRQLHSLQPTRIRDLLEAQQQFVQLAMKH